MGAVTLADVRDRAEPLLYPRARLEGCEDALVLFSSAFNGLQDAVWIAEAGLQAVCVDHDEVALDRMQPLYPDDWQFVRGDVYGYASGARAAGLMWDVVSLDVPTGQFEHAAAMLETWCALARKVVILGCGTRTRIPGVAGWRQVSTCRRSSYEGGVYWVTLERA